MKNPDDFKILLIEDDDVLRNALARQLKDWTADVMEASTVASGLDMLKKRPHLVILDIVLPDGSGVRIAEEMALIQPSPMAIAISGKASAGEAFRLKELGVLGYLPKPLSLDDFTQTLSSIIDSPPIFEPYLKAQVGKLSFRKVQQAVRKTMLEQAFHVAKGNKTHTAKLLNVSRQAVQQMIVDFEME